MTFANLNRLGLAPVLAATLLFPTACSKDQAWTETSREMHKLAGPGATNCGYVRLGEDKAAAIECAQSAVSEEQAFTVAFDVQGKDTQLIVGLASSGDRRTFLLEYDPQGWDPNSLKPGAQLLGKLLVYFCPSPPAIGDQGDLSCK